MQQRRGSRFAVGACSLEKLAGGRHVGGMWEQRPTPKAGDCRLLAECMSACSEAVGLVVYLVAATRWAGSKVAGGVRCNRRQQHQTSPEVILQCHSPELADQGALQFAERPVCIHATVPPGSAACAVV